MRFGYAAAEVTFPCAFKSGTTPTVSVTPDYSNDGIFSIVPALGSLTNTKFQPLAWASGAGTTGANNSYLAVGTWR